MIDSPVGETLSATRGGALVPTSVAHADGLDGARPGGSMGESLLLTSRPVVQHDGDIVIAQVEKLRRND